MQRNEVLEGTAQSNLLGGRCEGVYQAALSRSSRTHGRRTRSQETSGTRRRRRLRAPRSGPAAARAGGSRAGSAATGSSTCAAAKHALSQKMHFTFTTSIEKCILQQKTGCKRNTSCSSSTIDLRNRPIQIAYQLCNQHKTASAFCR